MRVYKHNLRAFGLWQRHFPKEYDGIFPITAQGFYAKRWSRRIVDLLDELRIYGEITPELGFQAITRHPLADEAEILDRLDMTPDQCWSCDLYWAFGKDLIFVSIWNNFMGGKPAVSYHFNEIHQFNVRTELSPLDTPAVKRALIYLATWITDHQEWLKKQKKKQSEQRVRVTNADICALEDG